MNPVFADAFFFFALLNEKDAAHQTAKSFSAQTDAPYVTTAWVLTEVADGCASPDRRGVFLRLLDMLNESPDAKIVPSSERLFERGINGLYFFRCDERRRHRGCAHGRPAFRAGGIWRVTQVIYFFGKIPVLRADIDRFNRLE